jgi:putative hemolysin
VLGIVSKHALFDQWLDGGRIDLEAALEPALFVPESMPALDMLERFREHQAKIALVIDEYGGIVGLVTINDVLAGLIGELPEGTGVDRDIVRREDGSWLMDGMVPLGELEHRIGQSGLRAQFEGRYHTVGGWVMAALGRIPVAGEVFEVAGATVEVVDMDGRRVDKVLVYGPDAATPSATSQAMPSEGNLS